MAETGNEKLLLVRGADAEIVEKKSRFIAKVRPVRTEEEALALIAAVRKEHRDARHNCYAYITGEPPVIEKYSDDGEPSKTAGLPMLDLLRKKQVEGVLVVVTRYFGGTLLGTGGLVRAYSGAAQEALDKCVLSARETGYIVTYKADYGLYGKLARMAEDEGLYVLEQEFESLVTLKLLVPETKVQRIHKLVTEYSAGGVKAEEEKKTAYCVVEGKPLIGS